ncbi:chemotaxis protein CheR [Chromobacterium sp. LK1]|uniref:CheR family methyltransferase n=1 Tax=Chromobacterium sp. LK1 TaxID=1628193 RepID=UPI0006536000|nr:CheR family methyltransferase [Chromobacterium sp. LK1]KMN33831.1 chemotaxis protein CheR [Chromobacterium sp. LK1]
MGLELDIKFTPDDFLRIRGMVYQRVGIALNDSKTHMAYARLAKRVRSLGLKSFAEYLDRLERDEVADEWQNFVNALTTNLTFFFREPHHFGMLRAHAEAWTRRGRSYRVWSAASSTGEEPYSIAMTLAELAERMRPFPFELLASDIDTHVLQQAMRGVYGSERTNKLPDAQLHRFFDKGVGANEGKVRVKKRLRDAVTFFQMNLVAPSWPELGEFDVIFCRNVLIYFDKPTQAAILNHMARHLAPDGLLLLGHSENILHLSDAFLPCGKTSYRLA